MGGCQNDGPFLGTLNIRCRIITGTQKGTIILTTTHVELVSLFTISTNPDCTLHSHDCYVELLNQEHFHVQFWIQGLGFSGLGFWGLRLRVEELGLEGLGV